MELPPPESSEDEEVDYSTPMKDESLEKIALKDADLPIVAQVEVLYDLEQAFTPNEEDDDPSDGDLDLALAGNYASSKPTMRR